MNYENELKNVLKEKFIDAKLISNTSNKVYQVKITNNQTLYAKFYENNSSHIDNELKIYNLIDNKFLKEIYYQSNNPKMAIFKELNGKTIDELNEDELENNSKRIILNICNYFDNMKKNKTKKYGLLDENLNGTFDDFHCFLKTRQKETSLILNEYKELKNIFNLIFEKYKNIIKPDNVLVPIDTNLKNIMLMPDNSIKFIDPGEMISGPILMGYGDLVAHIYKTPLYEKLITKLNINKEEEKLIRIYAIFSSLNILAFLKKNGITKLDEIIPFGNTHTFYNLIDEHLKYLNIENII